MAVVLDAGALIALERGDRTAWALYDETEAGDLVTHGGIVGQVWRGVGGRQARLARALGKVVVLPLDDARGRAAGRLLGRTRAHDVIDAALVLLARDGDFIVTSDPDDLHPLAVAAGLDVGLIVV